MTRPTKATTAGTTYLTLQRLATQRGRPTDELLQLYVLERFLARLALSDAAEKLVLKGGVLLAAFDARRPTRDIDFAARQVSNELEAIRALVIGILDVKIDDGVQFDRNSVGIDVIRDDALYSGARVTAQARVSRAKLTFHVDVNIGDPIHPAPQMVELPSLIGDAVRVLGYPIEMVLAEKLVTALDRGTTSTRWRDFADIWTLVCRHDVSGLAVTEASRRVAEHRDVAFRSLSERLDGYAALAQPRWAAWRTKFRLHQLPESFEEVLRLVCAFGEPIFDGSAEERHWHRDTAGWK